MAPSKYNLGMPITATTIVFAIFSVYYLFVAVHVVETSITRYSDFDRPVRHAMALVPAGLVRMRDALFVQFASEVKQPQQGVVAFSWALRLVLGAAQSYYNMTVRKRVWSPWPGIAEVISMAFLALMWIQATFKASRQQRSQATADLIDKADVPRSKTGSTSSTSGPPPPQHTMPHNGGLPKPIAAALMAAALLGCFGLGMMLTPEKFTDSLVTDAFYEQQPAVSSILNGLSGDSRANLFLRFKDMHLRVCRAFAELLGLQLLTEAVQLFLLPQVLPNLVSVVRLLRACTVRSALCAAVYAYNSWVPGMDPSCHVNTSMAVSFMVLYAGLYLYYQNRPTAGPGSDQGSKVD